MIMCTDPPDAVRAICEGIEMQLSRDELLGAYRRMKTIRMFEERLHEEIKTGEIAGWSPASMSGLTPGSKVM